MHPILLIMCTAFQSFNCEIIIIIIIIIIIVIIIIFLGRFLSIK